MAKERIPRPEVKENDGSVSFVVGWRDYLHSAAYQEWGDMFIARRGELSRADEGQVIAMIDVFYDALENKDPAEVAKAINRMADVVEGRRVKNRLLVNGGEKTVSGDQIFENIVERNFPEAEVRVEENGEVVLSTYNHGVVNFGKRALQEIIIKIGRSEEYGKQSIFDDGMELTKKGVRIFNPVGGDPRNGQFIGWKDAGGLGVAVEPLRLLDPLNALRRNFEGNPRAIDALGIVRVFERIGGQSDQEIPDMARIIVDDPNTWVKLFEELREQFGKDEKVKLPDGFETPVYWEDFIRRGLVVNRELKRNSLMEIEELVNIAKRAEREAIMRRHREERLALERQKAEDMERIEQAKLAEYLKTEKNTKKKGGNFVPFYMRRGK